MYKKITHTIVEEHFSHPMAVDIKSGLDSCTSSTRVMAINLDQAIQFRLNARNYFAALQNKVRNLVTDVITPRDQTTTDMKVAEVVNTVNRLGTLAAGYYGIAAGDELKRLLTEFALSVIEHVKVLKANGDVAAAKTKTAAAVDALAKFLSGANPEFWPATAVTKIFTDYADALVAQAAGSIKNDAKAIIDAENLQHDIILGNGSNITGLSDVFATGIINQFPNLFS